MNRKPLMFVVAMTAVAGCTLNRSELRQTSLLSKIGGGGQIIEPKRCALQVAILARPLRDAIVESTVWSVADEQLVASDLRRDLESNGLRVGLITGDVPAEVEALLKKTPTPGKGEPIQHINVPDGEPTLISLNEKLPQVSLLLNREGHASGRDYQDASGWFRVTPTHEGTSDVALRIVPEIHHGQLQRVFSQLPNAGANAPHQFMQKDGQQEDTLRELATTLKLKPGQVAVLGCHADASRSLGAFLFTETEANSDRLLQKVILIWATRTAAITPGGTISLPPGVEPIEPPDKD